MPAMLRGDESSPGTLGAAREGIPWRAIGIVAVAALVLRLAYVLTIASDTVGEGDAHFYHLQANLLADGRGFIDPFYEQEGRVLASANHPPAWPVLLAGPSLLGLTSYADHRAVGAFTGALAVLLVGVLGVRLGGRTVGVAAAVVAACNPVLIAVDGSLMSESLYGVWVLGAVIVALGLVRRPTQWRAVLLGALIGLAALTRSEGLGMLVLLALPAVWLARGDWRQRALRFGVAAVACLVVIAPWTIRNQVAFDAFVPLTTNDGSLIGGANCPAVYSGRDLGTWRFDCLSFPVGEDEADQARIWRDEGLEFMRDHLDRLPTVVAVRVLRTWGLYPPRSDLDEGVPRGFADIGVWYHWLTIPLVLFGIVVAWRRRATLWPFASIAALVTISSAIGWGVTRFRHAFSLMACVLVAFAVVAIAGRFSNRGVPPTPDRNPSRSATPSATPASTGR
jgi:4-amino-4-deoxy-L-arabinose transferase-like glycosyltransferase